MAGAPVGSRAERTCRKRASHEGGARRAWLDLQGNRHPRDCWPSLKVSTLHVVPFDPEGSPRLGGANLRRGPGFSDAGESVCFPL